MSIDTEPCGGLEVRPDQDFRDPTQCIPRRTPDQIAQSARWVLLGSMWDVSEPSIDVPRRCGGAYSHENNARYVRSLREARAARGGPPLTIVHMHRFELVPVTHASLPGFDARFLLRTQRPWSEVQRFFGGDRSPACRKGGCSLSDSLPFESTGGPLPRLRDLIDSSGVHRAGRYQQVVYYLSSSSEGTRFFHPRAAIADLRDPDYRAWRVAEAKRAIEIGGYDAIMLNHKTSQYMDRSGHWIANETISDVTALNSKHDTLWSAPPEGYGYREYVGGWAALARDLARAKVPYAVLASPAAFLPDDSRAEFASRANERTLFRRAALGARLLLLARNPSLDDRRFDAIVAQLRDDGIEVAIRSDCPVPAAPDLLEELSSRSTSCTRPRSERCRL